MNLDMARHEADQLDCWAILQGLIGVLARGSLGRKQDTVDCSARRGRISECYCIISIVVII